MHLILQTLGAGHEHVRLRAFSEDFPPHVRIGRPDAPTLETPLDKIFPDLHLRFGPVGPMRDGTFILPIFDEFLELRSRRSASSITAAGVVAYQLPMFERLACSVWLDREPALFKIIGLGGDDTLLLTIFSKTRVVASVQHADEPEACWAECANGDKGQPCVDCEAGGMRIRVCC